MKEHQKHIFWLLWFGWLVLDLLTAVLMEIYTDEGYYWMWSKHLDWGYYDHPPMVAAWIWLSGKLFPFGGGLSVRLMTVLMHGITVWLIWKILPQSNRFEMTQTESSVGLWQRGKSIILFFVVAASMVMFSAAGFLTTPDAPMLLFSAAYFYCLKRYYQESGIGSQESGVGSQESGVGNRKAWLWAMAIGVCLALMTYSKYMVVPVLGLTIIANPKLVKDIRMWAALVVAGVLLIPHAWWQIENGFPSLKFHLVARSDPFEWSYLLDYLPNQLVVFNPIVFVVGLVLSVRLLWGKNKREDLFTRTMAWQIVGFVGFFALMTFRGHVEPHWTMTCSVAFIVLTTQWLSGLFTDRSEQPSSQATKVKQYVYWSLVVIVAVVCLARVVLWTNMLSTQTGLGSKKARFATVDDLREDRDVVVFQGSFQWTSMYRWFENEDAILVHDMRMYRHTQYEAWHLEIPYQGRSACILAPCPGAEELTAGGDHYFRRMVDHLQTTDAMVVRPLMLTQDGQQVTGEIEVTNPYPVPFVWNHDEMPAQMMVVGLVNNEWCYTPVAIETDNEIIEVAESATYRVTVDAEWLHSGQKIAFGMYNGVVLTQNSEWITLE